MGSGDKKLLAAAAKKPRIDLLSAPGNAARKLVSSSSPAQAAGNQALLGLLTPGAAATNQQTPATGVGRLPTGVVLGPDGRVAVAPERNVFPDFAPVSPGLSGVAQEQAASLSSQLGIPVRADRMLEAPWTGRVYQDEHSSPLLDANGNPLPSTKSGDDPATSGQSSSQGWERNHSRFWSEFERQFPEDYALLNPDRSISEAFAKRMGWPTTGPDSVVGDTMEHHHVGNGPLVAAVPTQLHKSVSGDIHAKVDSHRQPEKKIVDPRTGKDAKRTRKSRGSTANAGKAKPAGKAAKAPATASPAKKSAIPQQSPPAAEAKSGVVSGSDPQAFDADEARISTRNQTPLTAEQRALARRALSADMGVPPEKILFHDELPDSFFGARKREEIGTSYWRDKDVVVVAADIIPLPPSQRPKNLANRANAEVGPLGVLGHEAIGHREAKLGGQTRTQRWHEESQASTRAAIHTPGISDSERMLLLKDAAARVPTEQRSEKIYIDLARYGPDGREIPPPGSTARSGRARAQNQLPTVIVDPAAWSDAPSASDAVDVKRTDAAPPKLVDAHPLSEPGKAASAKQATTPAKLPGNAPARQQVDAPEPTKPATAKPPAPVPQHPETKGGDAGKPAVPKQEHPGTAQSSRTLSNRLSTADTVLSAPLQYQRYRDQYLREGLGETEASIKAAARAGITLGANLKGGPLAPIANAANAFTDARNSGQGNLEALGTTIGTVGGGVVANELAPTGPAGAGVQLLNTAAHVFGAPQAVQDTTSIAAELVPSSVVTTTITAGARSYANLLTGDTAALQKQADQMSAGHMGTWLQGHAQIASIITDVASGDSLQHALEDAAKAGKGSVADRIGSGLADAMFDLSQNDEAKDGKYGPQVQQLAQTLDVLGRVSAGADLGDAVSKVYKKDIAQARQLWRAMVGD